MKRILRFLWPIVKFIVLYFLLAVVFVIALSFFPSTYNTIEDGTRRFHSWASTLVLIAPVVVQISPALFRRKSRRSGSAVVVQHVQAHTSDPASIQLTDDILIQAIEAIYNTGMASASMIQRKTGCEYTVAAEILNTLEHDGIVGPFDGKMPLEILVSHDTAYFRSGLTRPAAEQEQVPTLCLTEADGMDGHTFEYWCADLLRANGFADVEVTPGSGDQGVDVLAQKDGIRYAIQCKCYSHDLGNKPVQEIHTGRAVYHCHIGVVMTNRHFTKGAVDAANATGVLLWDRDKLQEMISASNMKK